MKQELGIDKKTFERWRKGLAKKQRELASYDVLIKSEDDILEQSPTIIKPPIRTDVKSQLEKSFEKFKNNDDPNKHVTYEDDIWKITFPKIAEDLIDVDTFKINVTDAVVRFFKIYFPLQVEVAKNIEFSAETVSIDPGQFTGMYPEVNLKPIISGKKSVVDKFMKSIRQWSGFELFWKGSFLKSKSSGKINSIRLTGLSYNIPDKFDMGQPTSYVEKILI